MAVECIEVTNTSTILEPYSQHKTTPPPPPPSSTPTLVPLTIFDRAAFNMHVISLYAFKPPTPSSQALKEGLNKALHFFPHLSGRLVSDDRSRPSIIIDNTGIRLVEANFNMKLEEMLPLEPSDQLESFYPTTKDVEELLQVQLNRFAGGGLIMGVTTNHMVADGQSMSSFLLAWARLVQGLELDRLPYHDRAAIATPRNPPRCDFDHANIEFRELPPSPPASSSVVQVALHFTPDFISNLKNKTTGGNTTRRCSTFQCLLTHVWKKLTLARNLPPHITTHVQVAVNGRGRMNAPQDYFGNLVLWAYPTMQVKDLLDRDYTSVASIIKEAVGEVDESYFKSFADFNEVLKREGREGLVVGAPPGKIMSPNLEVDSWLGFEFHGLDFGGGPPCGFTPPSVAVEGLVVFVPSCVRKGGVDVFLGVLGEQVDHFDMIAYKLD